MRYISEGITKRQLKMIHGPKTKQNFFYMLKSYTKTASLGWINCPISKFTVYSVAEKDKISINLGILHF